MELDERLARGRRGGHTPADLLRMATEHGHAGLGWPEAGRLVPGAHADLTTVASTRSAPPAPAPPTLWPPPSSPPPPPTSTTWWWAAGSWSPAVATGRSTSPPN